MRSIKQLLRQPIRLFAGILLVSLSVAILTICIGQYTATHLTRTNLDDRYTTIGLLSSEYLREFTGQGIKYLSALPEEKQAWIDETVQTRTDIIKTVSSTGLVSAYIPELNIDNFSKYQYGYHMDRHSEGYPYRCAMLTVTLTKIGTIETENAVYHGTQKCPTDTTILCVGTVESVVGLEKGFARPVKQTIVLHITVPSKEAFDALNLQIGQTYLVYGEDFTSGTDDAKRGRIVRDAYEELFGKLYYSLGGLLDFKPMLAQFDCVLTLCDPASITAWMLTYDETTGKETGYVRSDQYEVHYWDGENIKRKWIPADEYAPYYQLPTITPLNGSVDEFLASEEGSLWQEALDKMEINNHGFPVLCLDKLGYQAAFSREQARIVAGRDFTEGELLNGEKVCIISQTVAARSGVQVGDTIQLRTYGRDPTLSDQLYEMTGSGSFPSAALYSEALGFSSEMETYTIVGLYRQENAWENRFDAYGFTPNTIFVPKASVTAEMEIRDKGIYSTLVLHNGKMEEFQTLMAEAGYPDLFICYDQGYSEFVASLDAYEEVSVKALYIGIAAYAVLMLLFVFLFPAMQRRALTTMFSLGAPRRKRVRHIFVSSAVILLPGTIIGGFAGSKLWSLVADRLMQSLNIQIPLEANMPVIAPALAAAHLILMALVVLLAAIPLTKNNSTMKCK